jgi:transposase
VNHCAIAGSQARRLVIPSCVMSTNDALPDDVETLKQLVLARDAELAQARAEVAQTRAEASSVEALVAHLRLEIEKLKRDLFGPRNERKERLLDQLELQLEEMEAAAAEDEVAAEKAAATTEVRAFSRKKPARRPFPAHLPRERVIVPGPTTCTCCGSSRLAKLGEDVTETLEVVPRQWKVVQHVRAGRGQFQAPLSRWLLPNGRSMDYRSVLQRMVASRQ